MKDRRHLMPAYPYKIENGEGEVITFLGVVRERDGDRLEIEVYAPPNVGAPMHLHHQQDEAITVLAGRIGLQFAGEQPRYAGPGETIFLQRGVGHRWWNAGTTELRCTGWASPPHNLEFFLTALFASMKRSGGKRPGFFDAAFLLTRYRSEIRMLDIPAVVQKLVFPVLLAAGKLFGKFDKFKDAPEPVLKTLAGSPHSTPAA